MDTAIVFFGVLIVIILGKGFAEIRKRLDRIENRIDADQRRREILARTPSPRAETYLAMDDEQ